MKHTESAEFLLRKAKEMNRMNASPMQIRRGPIKYRGSRVVFLGEMIKYRGN